MFMRRGTILAGLIFASSSPAHAAQWYEIVTNKTTSCVDSASAGAPELATPDGTAATYTPLGELVSVDKVPDGAGASIVVMRITDPEGDPFLNVVFYPSLSDCQAVLAYERKQVTAG